MSHNTKALIEKVKSIGVKLHSYFDSDAIISLDILLDGLNSNTTCNTCIEHIDNNPVQCASCFHQYHKKCQNVSYVLKKNPGFVIHVSINNFYLCLFLLFYFLFLLIFY